MSVDQPLVQTRLRLRIPQHYHQEPVISKLVSHYHVTVNIAAAVLGANAEGDGWFDLVLQGQPDCLEQALHYLHDLEIEVWSGSDISAW
ncbi:MAG: NIL domain-containing protein [Synechococcales cyanobacterium K44_A2020_017]|uniref:NIL domain-containing protein n=1 Tax=Leptolyngbya sp. CCY15150 TaxID=2767772 RepID=UPI0019502411|nr:NIL domain-containing protein [Leptolyngbya sp. CCY15150]MBF2089597.1 NIL domain-containing protein [Synechococcales cyanobacterium K32_A2020_035]MBF2096694.1 NIL domain-containing protein [Synechococcales cyanobacterium K44_A2020_017]